ncbi:MAG: hypothetical protein KDA96_06880 [Planctomycetaceae bacterium]|nr:hypothetical protein [Planctomycetaceae bacterium]
MGDPFLQNCFRVGLLILPLFTCGCGGEVPPEQYVIDASETSIRLSDDLRDQFDVIPFRWDVPESWKTAENDEFSAFAWSSGAGDTEARITLTKLGMQSGVMAQVARWRNQLKLQPLGEDELAGETSAFPLEGATGTYTELKNDEKTILGLIVPDGSSMWIFKYSARLDAPDDQPESFRQFCKSLKLTTAE